MTQLHLENAEGQDTAGVRQPYQPLVKISFIKSFFQTSKGLSVNVICSFKRNSLGKWNMKQQKLGLHKEKKVPRNRCNDNIVCFWSKNAINFDCFFFFLPIIEVQSKRGKNGKCAVPQLLLLSHVLCNNTVNRRLLLQPQSTKMMSQQGQRHCGMSIFPQQKNCEGAALCVPISKVHNCVCKSEPYHSKEPGFVKNLYCKF